jgi:hypothetical protein
MEIGGSQMRKVHYLAIILAALMLLGADPSQWMALAVAVIGGLMVVAIESLINR